MRTPWARKVKGSNPLYPTIFYGVMMKEELINVETIWENGIQKVVLTTKITTASGVSTLDKIKVTLPKLYEILTVGLIGYLRGP